MKNRTEMHEGLIELTRRCRIFAYLCDNSNQPRFWADGNAPQFVLANALRASEVARLIVQPLRQMKMQ